MRLAESDINVNKVEYVTVFIFSDSAESEITFTVKDNDSLNDKWLTINDKILVSDYRDKILLFKLIIHNKKYSFYFKPIIIFLY